MLWEAIGKLIDLDAIVDRLQATDCQHCAPFTIEQVKFAFKEWIEQHIESNEMQPEWFINREFKHFDRHLPELDSYYFPEQEDDLGLLAEELGAAEPNHFNDVRLVVGFNGKIPVIEGAGEATTEPGYYCTDNPMKPQGAARIAFGQYRVWQVGTHGYSESHQALIQVVSVKVHRDWNRDMIRTGDAIDEGYFGINQHHGYDHPINDIYTASAGCLVGQTRNGYAAFMASIKRDVRFIKDINFVFSTTILDGSQLGFF